MADPSAPGFGVSMVERLFWSRQDQSSVWAYANPGVSESQALRASTNQPSPQSASSWNSTLHASVE